MPKHSSLFRFVLLCTTVLLACGCAAHDHDVVELPQYPMGKALYASSLEDVRGGAVKMGDAKALPAQNPGYKGTYRPQYKTGFYGPQSLQ